MEYNSINNYGKKYGNLNMKTENYEPALEAKKIHRKNVA